MQLLKKLQGHLAVRIALISFLSGLCCLSRLWTRCYRQNPLRKVNEYLDSLLAQFILHFLLFLQRILSDRMEQKAAVAAPSSSLHPACASRQPDPSP